MTTIHVQLDEATYEKARRLAEAQGRTVEQLTAAVIERIAEGPAVPADQRDAGDIAGIWADDDAVVQRMIKDIMSWRVERCEAMGKRIDELADRLGGA